MSVSPSIKLVCVLTWNLWLSLTTRSSSRLGHRMWMRMWMWPVNAWNLLPLPEGVTHRRMRAVGADWRSGPADWTTTRSSHRWPVPAVTGCLDSPECRGWPRVARPRAKALEKCAVDALWSGEVPGVCLCFSLVLILKWLSTSFCFREVRTFGSLNPIGAWCRRTMHKHQEKAAKWNKKLINEMLMKASVKNAVENLHKTRYP